MPKCRRCRRKWCRKKFVRILATISIIRINGNLKHNIDVSTCAAGARLTRYQFGWLVRASSEATPPVLTTPSARTSLAKSQSHHGSSLVKCRFNVEWLNQRKTNEMFMKRKILRCDWWQCKYLNRWWTCHNKLLIYDKRWERFVFHD